MAAGRCAYNEIVAEPLTTVNQAAWFVCVKNFLIARDLWEVVEGTTKLSKNSVKWKRKNAEALHIMQISCAPESFSRIMDVSEAKVAWDLLKEKYSKKPTKPPQVMEEVGSDFYATKLVKAICQNNCDDVRTFFLEHPGAGDAALTSTGKTALHVAALFGHVEIVQQLVDSFSPYYLEKRDDVGQTPLIIAAYTGVTPVAECMVNKNGRILGIPTPDGKLPVSVALAAGHKKMAHFLYHKTPLHYLKPDRGCHGSRLLFYCFKSGDLGIALDLLQKCIELLFALDENGWTPIENIASMPSAFPSGSQLVFWKQWIYNSTYIESIPVPCSDEHSVESNPFFGDEHSEESNPLSVDEHYVRMGLQFQRRRIHGLVSLLQMLISYPYNLLGGKEIFELKLLHAHSAEILSLVCDKVSFGRLTSQEANIVTDVLFCAAKEGTIEFVVEVLKAKPNLIQFIQGSFLLDTFLFAVQNRQAAVFNFIHGLRFKDALVAYTDDSGNSLLHVAGMLAPSSQLNRIPGAALQMQREVQWFKEVESVVPRALRVSHNNDGKQPEDIFKESHKELRKEEEEWMKGTSSSCSVVGALIVTMMFTAAFTVPGGNNQDFGYPIFLGKKSFLVFIISDALSLFFSTTSVLMFLGILTSRYLEEDFLKSLPRKLIIGLSSLFISIATMMIAFSATILIMLEHRHTWALLPIIMLASVPVTLFVLLQFPLLVQIIYSTYGPSIFHRNVKPWP